MMIMMVRDERGERKRLNHPHSFGRFEFVEGT
jgi:hypothetical protein